MSKSEKEPKSKKSNQPMSNKKAVLLTLLTMFLTGVVLVTVFMLGVRYEKQINNRVLSEAKSLSAQVVVEQPVSKK